MELTGTFESEINRSDYKILIVDDVVSNVLLLKILLTNEKFQVCTASNGNTCIEQAKKEIISLQQDFKESGILDIKLVKLCQALPFFNNETGLDREELE